MNIQNKDTILAVSKIQDVTLRSLLPYVSQQLGPHHIRTNLYSFLLFSIESFEQEDAKTSLHLDSSTLEYRLDAMIMDVTHITCSINHRAIRILPNLVAGSLS